MDEEHKLYHRWKSDSGALVPLYLYPDTQEANA